MNHPINQTRPPQISAEKLQVVQVAEPDYLRPEHVAEVKWVGFAASVPGAGHIRYGIPCQDASLVQTSPRPALIVCDGRGSAKLSHFGAFGAVEAFRRQVSILEPFLCGTLDCEEEKSEQWIKFCRIMYRTLMQVKYDLAAEHNLPEKEFDFTVAFAIAGRRHIGCFQVGDGAIVLRQKGICMTVFLPEKGEFANQTHFLRPGGEIEMKFRQALYPVQENSGIAITSDGPEHLMFHLADMTPGNVFAAFFDDLCRDELCRQDIMDYLTRREWMDDPRGSDDRSLALLVNTAAARRSPAETVDATDARGYDECGPEMPPALLSGSEAVPEPQPEAENADGVAESDVSESSVPREDGKCPAVGKDSVELRKTVFLMKQIMTPILIATALAGCGYAWYLADMVNRTLAQAAEHRESIELTYRNCGSPKFSGAIARRRMTESQVWHEPEVEIRGLQNHISTTETTENTREDQP